MDAGHIGSDLLYRLIQIRLTVSRDEDVCAFVDKLLRRRKTDAASAARNERNFSFELMYVRTPS